MKSFTSFRIATRKVYKETTWSLVIVALLIVGLTTWMVIPSINASLQQGLSEYGNSMASYIFVYDTGNFDSYHSRIPSNVTNKIATISGVQRVYPILSNWTYFEGIPFTVTLQNGTKRDILMTMGVKTAVISGQSGYPQELIAISSGHAPSNETAEFLVNVQSEILEKEQIFTVGFAKGVENGRVVYEEFNATISGHMQYNPMLREIGILWNPTFLRSMLDSRDYEQTFGGIGANYFIIKVQDINQVKQVVSEVQPLFTNYSGYSLIYDQATIDAQQSFQSSSGVLYEVIAVFSLCSVISLVFLLTYIFSIRRRWETGLLITQGWSWLRVAKLFFYYYLFLGFLAVTVSVPLSVFIGRQFGYSFQVYANTLTIPITISTQLIVSSIVISLLVSTVAGFFAIWTMKKTGLDNLLREY